mmetsp:Transcript_10339/g.10409  ORF Transcript_10339/g.10409 Transcript_10339/m.10409 type:complete len:711 (+) Transcript_10339:114-2246(+)
MSTDNSSHNFDYFFNLGCNNYSPGEFLGRGTFGFVIQAYDHKNNRKLAVKCIINIDRSEHQVKTVLREMYLLHELRHKNILSLYDINIKGNEIFIVTDYIDYPLHRIIYAERGEHKRIIRKRSDYVYVLCQLLEATQYLHSVNVIHRDIKPANILLSTDLKLKLCDFGFAIAIENESLTKKAELLTEYVVTRWYRAPEVYLNPGKYGKAQDVWSVACAFCEIFRRYPLFPGKNTVDQVRIIAQTLGELSDEDTDFEMTDRSKRFLSNIKFSGERLEDAIKDASVIHPSLFGLLEVMLKFNPNRRITAENALQHPIFKKFRDARYPEKRQSLSLEAYDRCLERVQPCTNREELLEVVTEEVHRIRSELEDDEAMFSAVPDTKCEAENSDIMSSSSDIAQMLTSFERSHRRNSFKSDTSEVSTLSNLSLVKYCASVASDISNLTFANAAPEGLRSQLELSSKPSHISINFPPLEGLFSSMRTIPLLCEQDRRDSLKEITEDRKIKHDDRPRLKNSKSVSSRVVSVARSMFRWKTWKRGKQIPHESMDENVDIISSPAKPKAVKDVRSIREICRDTRRAMSNATNSFHLKEKDDDDAMRKPRRMSGTSYISKGSKTSACSSSNSITSSTMKNEVDYYASDSNVEMKIENYDQNKKNVWKGDIMSSDYAHESVGSVVKAVQESDEGKNKSVSGGMDMGVLHVDVLNALEMDEDD